MYHIEIYNRTALKVVKSKTASTDVEAAKVARSFISDIKERCEVVKESPYNISPRGYILGQTLYTVNEVYDISTAKT